jgi:hypothetical protein
VVRTERAVRLGASIAVAVVLSGGSAWAVSGGLGSHPHTSAGTEATTTTVADSSTSSTATTDTTVADSTTTSVTEATTTTVETSPTTVSTPTTTTAGTCKPGWGYGDTNHCHSGPPGLANPHHGSKHHGRP